MPCLSREAEVGESTDRRRVATKMDKMSAREKGLFLVYSPRGHRVIFYYLFM